jgi:CheY-like chemotaxis protein
MMIATQVSKDHYLYPILDKDASFYHSHNENSNHYQHYHSQPSSSSPPHHLQNQESNTAAVERTWKDPFIKRILVVDDDPDITLTFKVGLEEYHYYHDDKRRFEVYTYNNPAVALSEFKLSFYDLLLTDIYMPYMNGFELCEKLLELDINVRVCFISSTEVNIGALREVYPKARSIGCFIKKPVTIEYLVKRLLAELD